LEREVAGFNAQFKVGDVVAYREVLRDDCPVQVFSTRTEAQILSGHSAVVWLNGKSGCVLISHCRKATPEEVHEASEAQKLAEAETTRRATRKAEAKSAISQLNAAPYVMHPDAFRRLRNGEPSSIRKKTFCEPAEVKMYEGPLVDALVHSVRELMRLSLHNDLPEAERIEIAERAVDLLEKFTADEPVPF
jgi:hypothetical protein